MNSREIRQRFLDYFKQKGHSIVKSAPMVIKNDPSLMFTNAGMNQFKDFFLGNDIPDNPRIADTQKCLRVSGKHNDLEEVGIDTYHHTMFEMLGNWSIGEYFKKDALQWAWEFLTEELKISPENLYATVFEGNKEEGLAADAEAYNEWVKYLPKEKVLYQDKKDNFWEMGESGPCGPSSEIHVDLRSEEEKSKIPAVELINKDHPHVIEIWNIVFIQYNRLASGELMLLKKKHVDTGMGFERLCMLMQGKNSNYDTDVFTPIISEIEKISNVKYGLGEKTDIAIRVISDHIRAVAVAISEGQLPSNAKAGYVIRRILRRAVRYGYTFLGLKEPFMHKLVKVLSKQFDRVFDEIKEQEDFISRVILEEEQSFLRTLERGLKRLDQLISETKKRSQRIINGKDVFELYDTYGFPLDLTALIARENDLKVDEMEFQDAMDQQKGRSKKDAEKVSGDWTIVNEGSSVFKGYDTLECDTRILRYRKQTLKGKDQFQLVLESTPFYAEGGGQVGDTGLLIAGDEKIPIVNTIKENDLIIHISTQLPSKPEAEFKAQVNVQKRLLTQNNHSATHLLHAALREVLGNHVQQKGSLVNEKILRFDFSHFAKMTNEEIRKVEKIVNERIRQNIKRGEDRHLPFDEAVKRGAMALFGEKYGDDVRVITFDPDFSIELCGGTHVDYSGQIGLFKIISESSVAAGVRRIEAITSEKAEEYVLKQEELIHEIKEVLKQPKDLKKSIEQLLKERDNLSARIKEVEEKEVQDKKNKIFEDVIKKGNVNILNSNVDLPNADGLKQLLFNLKQKYDNLFAVISAQVNGKPMLGIMISDELVSEKNLNAGQLVKEWSKEIKGGGGGQPFFATAGGSDPSGLKKVNELAEKFIKDTF